MNNPIGKGEAARGARLSKTSTLAKVEVEDKSGNSLEMVRRRKDKRSKVKVELEEEEEKPFCVKTHNSEMKMIWEEFSEFQTKHEKMSKHVEDLEEHVGGLDKRVGGLQEEIGQANRKIVFLHQSILKSLKNRNLGQGLFRIVPVPMEIGDEEKMNSARASSSSLQQLAICASTSAGAPPPSPKVQQLEQPELFISLTSALGMRASEYEKKLKDVALEAVVTKNRKRKLVSSLARKERKTRADSHSEAETIVEALTFEPSKDAGIKEEEEKLADAEVGTSGRGRKKKIVGQKPLQGETLKKPVKTLKRLKLVKPLKLKTTLKLRKPGKTLSALKLKKPKTLKDIGKVACRECGKVFSAEKNAFHHEWVVHALKNERFKLFLDKCRHCDKEYRHMGNLAKHQTACQGL